MAGRRAKPRKAGTLGTRKNTRRGTRREDDNVPDVFRDMLSEAVDQEPQRPLKRRKVAGSATQVTSSPPTELGISNSSKSSLDPLDPPSQVPDTQMTEPNDSDAGLALQTITDSEESDESDMEWEDALVQENEETSTEEAEPEIGDLEITIGGHDKGKSKEKEKKQMRRRGITSVDKKRRLEIHRMHILCLLYHAHRRNAWCNDVRIQASLSKLPRRKTLEHLVPDLSFAQAQLSTRFITGMTELMLMWSKRFSITAQGLHKPHWVNVEAGVNSYASYNELDSPMTRLDLLRATEKLEGSQDVGAQLFCALLRGVGIETRLVCSLQVLPFASQGQPTPSKSSDGKQRIYLESNDSSNSPSPSKAVPATPRPKMIKRPLSRLEQAVGDYGKAKYTTGVAPVQKKKFHSPYPVYWVEAYNPGARKWTPIDPLSTSTVGRPDKIEPPLSWPTNSLVYAIGFEEDGTATDVTRRYAKAYNAKTRKFRIDNTPDGTSWLKAALEPFKRARILDRDQLEADALKSKEGHEGLPKNIQDYKDHPIYVLERHLRHNEVIHPRNPTGKVNVGTSMNKKMEDIFRRKDVHVVRSADKWYRMGRDVKSGEQPMKHAKPRKRARNATPIDLEEAEALDDEVGAALYAAFQTELYVPPPVRRGKVPRNGYGNLDVYVPSMVPKGGVHIRHQHAAKAARAVGVDYADAVTGFSFKGRHGTAIVQGVIVAEEYQEAVEEVLRAMAYAQEEAENAQRSAEALRMWRRFYLGLRIAQRVNAIEIEGETGEVGMPDAAAIQAEIEREDRELAEKQMAGGFFPDDATGPLDPPTVSRESMISQYDLNGGEFIQDDYAGGGGGFLPAADYSRGLVPEDVPGYKTVVEHPLRPRQHDDMAGGFVPEDEAGGGFWQDDQTEQGPTTRLFSDRPGGPIPDEDECVTELPPAAEPLGSADPVGEPVPGEITTSPVAFRTVPEVHVDSVENERMTDPQPVSTKVTADLPEIEDSPPKSSMSDAGSLPLEDPDDEDADPEWLIDAT